MNRFKCPACGGDQYTACDTAEGCIYCGNKKLEKMDKLEPEESEGMKMKKLTTWHTPLIAELDEIINCADCGKQVTYGDCYTSLTIHTNTGMGYPVCEKCYEKEWEERRAVKDE
jgi:transcription elongation factor Elf1